MSIAAAFVDEGKHRSTQRLGASGRRGDLELGECTAGEGDRSLRIHVPVGDEQSPRARVEEGTRQTGERAAVELVASRGIAGGHYHPISVELELRHLRGREQAIVLLACLLG